MLTQFMDDKVKARIGARIGERTVPVIAYADDEVLISMDPAELKVLLDIAFQHSCLWQCQYNAAKSNIVIYGAKGSRNSWKLGNEIIDSVDEYSHLGVIILRGLW